MLQKPYWTGLLIWGVLLGLAGGILIAVGLERATSNHSGGALIILGAFTAGVGQVLLIPGLIGWGISAAGIRPGSAPAYRAQGTGNTIRRLQHVDDRVGRWMDPTKPPE